MPQKTADPEDYGLDSALPSSVDCERTILGAILLDENAYFDDCLDNIQSEDFSLDSHRRIYLRMSEIMEGLVEEHHLDIRTLANNLGRNGEVGTVGGVAYIASLTEGLPRRPVIEEYVRIVKDKSRLRKLMAVCSSAIAHAADQSESALGVVTDLENKLMEIKADGPEHSTPIGSIDVESEIRKKRTVSDERTALELTWGVKGLDDHTRGAFKGEFTVVGGEESSGKSAFLLQMILANAVEGVPCGLFSLEMSKDQVKRRCYPLLSDILTSSQIRDPRLINAHTHIPEMERVTQELGKLPIYIDDTRELRIDKLINRMRMMRRKLGVRLFGIDFMQLVKVMPKMQQQEAFIDMVIKLRDVPATVIPDCHLVALSQYSNQDGFVKGKKRATTSYYGGSVIRYAAQNLLMISVEDPEKRDRLDLLDAEIRVAKQRDGARGKVSCYYDRDHYKFTYPIQPLKGM
jgi:replicative DNA helicase